MSSNECNKNNWMFCVFGRPVYRFAAHITRCEDVSVVNDANKNDHQKSALISFTICRQIRKYSHKTQPKAVLHLLPSAGTFVARSFEALLGVVVRKKLGSCCAWRPKMFCVAAHNVRFNFQIISFVRSRRRHLFAVFLVSRHRIRGQKWRIMISRK